jgi:hypothetical protein
VRPIEISYGLKRSKWMTLRIWLNIENIYVSRGNNRSKTKQISNSGEELIKIKFLLNLKITFNEHRSRDSWISPEHNKRVSRITRQNIGTIVDYSLTSSTTSTQSSKRKIRKFCKEKSWFPKDNNNKSSKKAIKKTRNIF